MRVRALVASEPHTGGSGHAPLFRRPNCVLWSHSILGGPAANFDEYDGVAVARDHINIW